MKMQDLHKSFNRQASDLESAEEDYSTNNMNITKTEMPTSTQNNAVHTEQMTGNPTTNQTYTEDMDVDSLTTSPTVTTTNINCKEMEGNLSTIKLTTSLTMSMSHSRRKDTEGNSLTDEPNGTMTINVTTKHEDYIEMEEPLTPENINLFTITNTTSTPITITLPKSSFVYLIEMTHYQIYNQLKKSKHKKRKIISMWRF